MSSLKSEDEVRPEPSEYHAEAAPRVAPVWTEFERATLLTTTDASVAFAVAEQMRNPDVGVWVNSIYQVTRTVIGRDAVGEEEAVHLSIKRRAGGAIHDWRDLQLIKNELCGTEWGAIEIYPPESKLVDLADQFHLFAFRALDLPFMFRERAVSETVIGGGSQREFAHHVRPRDLLTHEELAGRLRAS